MKQVSVFKTGLHLALAGLVGLQVACSSSSDSGPASAAISGSVVAAPVSGASVQLKDAAGNALADPVITGSDGSYSVTVTGAVPDALVLESTGGTYSDEASGAATDAGMLMAYVDGASMSAGGELHATPASTIVSRMVMTHGMTLTDAQAAFESAFGFAADTATAPADATASVADATEEELLAGLRAAVFSQLTKDLGLAPTEQFDLLAALAEDLADGELDGEGVSGAISVTTSVMLPIDIQSRFSQALVAFHTSANNKTGLLNNQIGIIPFAKVTLTDSYKIEYVSDIMPMQGKSMFKLRISDKDTGAAVSENVTLMLMMYMEDREHSTPDLNCKESLTTAGEYDCTVYYLMPSVMATGDSMGYWQINVMDKANKQSAMLYPQVMMAMGDTTRVALKGQAGDDTIMMMGEEVSRTYNLFKESLMGNTGNHTFEVFIAPMETMMSFPALETGIALIIDPAADPVTTFPINTVTVEFSTDETNWTPANNAVNGSGIWSASIDSLTDGVEGKIYVRLSVNNELKTTDGKVPGVITDVNGDPILDENNDPIPNTYNIFKVTPGGM
jgi:hypothetical protein